ncbi:hypothetical protein [Prescottella agglutinans]|uniref:Low molecular weight antigen MTB12-like C-terminal domain-containing protein n=1 Tax=Prescottella agglutinans TaxID=1644129 RepID=A0ABT6M7P9_9NOCA|nr:hypothetical protein [Prescottella agglutinans]MDH6280285.1 hypothetical protein [Prescottella agglutinans]
MISTRVKGIGRAATVGAMCLAVLALSACTDEKEPTPPPTTSTTTTAPSQPPIPAPTPTELNASLVRAFDENVPAAEKVTLVQGAEADPQLIDQVVAAAKANKASAQVTDVTDLGDGTVAATVVMTLDGQPGPETIINFVAEDGVWKLSQVNACGIVGMAGLSSPACA